MSKQRKHREMKLRAIAAGKANTRYTLVKERTSNVLLFGRGLGALEGFL